MTAPSYADEAVTLYHGDCLEVTEWLDADVLVTDPPYGTSAMKGNPRGGYGRRDIYSGGQRLTAGRDDGSGATIASDDSTGPRDAVLAVWGSRPACVFSSPRLPEPPGVWSDRLVWDKKRPGMNGGPWRYRHESIFVTEGFVRSSNAAVSIIEAWSDQTDHIHAKPLALMLKLVAACPPGVIADPFAGSGSTLVAARNLGRRAIGVELEERYCEVIARRLAQDVLDFGDVS
jgi:DNA modification methylase